MTAREVSLPADRCSPSQGVDDRLGRLFGELFTGAAGEPVDNPVLAERLVACTSRSALDQVLASADLDSRRRGLLTLGQQVLDDYFSQPAFHPQLSRRLLDGSGAMLALLLEDDGWLNGHKHPFYRLLEPVADLALGWHPDHVQAGEVAARAEEWLGRCAGDEPLEELVGIAATWGERFRARTAKLAQRLRDREEGALRLQYANREAARVINRQLAGRELPGPLARDLQRVWLPGLQWVLLNESSQSGLWHHAVRVLTLLFWSVQPPRDSDRAREKRRRVAADVRKALPELLGRILPEPGLSERVVEGLQRRQAGG